MNIAVLIDADNTQADNMEAILDELSRRGRPAIRRAFANWRKENVKPWVETIKRLAIKAEQQFDYVKGKNTTDMALIISALDLLHTADCEAFAIVSSDSDFTPLAIRLREGGKQVIGIGEQKTPEPFRAACDEFIFIEALASSAPPSSAAPLPPTDPSQQANAPAETGAPTPKPAPKSASQPTLEELHETLRRLAEEQGKEGYLDTATAGSQLQQLYPGFNIRKYGGRAKVTTFCGLYPKLYKLEKKGSGKAAKFRYRWLGGKPAAAPVPSATPSIPARQLPAASPSAPAAPVSPQQADEPPVLVLTPVDSMTLRVRQRLLDAYSALVPTPGDYLMLSLAGAHLRKNNPNFSVQSLGYDSLKSFLVAFPEVFELLENKLPKTTIFSFRPR